MKERTPRDAGFLQPVILFAKVRIIPEVILRNTKNRLFHPRTCRTAGLDIENKTRKLVCNSFESNINVLPRAGIIP